MPSEELDILLDIIEALLMDITVATYQLMMRQRYMQLMKRVRVVEGIVMFGGPAVCRFYFYKYITI